MSHSENESTHPEFLNQSTLACLVERAGEMVVAFDAEFRILYANVNARRILKRFFSPVLGSVLWEVIPTAIGTPTHQHYTRAMRDRIPIDFEAKSDGMRLWFEHRCLPTDDGGLLVLVRDVTQRQEALEQLRKSEEELRATVAALQEREAQLRALSDNLPDAAVFQIAASPEGERRFLYFSEGIETLTGIPAAEILRDARLLYGRVHSDDRERLRRAEEDALRNASEFACDIRLCAAGGKSRWLRLHSRPRTVADGATVWDGVQLDITERKRLEADLHVTLDRYELATAGTKTGVWDFDYDTQTWYRSPSLWDILGYGDVPEEERPANLFHLLHPDDAPRTLSHFEAFLNSPVPLFEGEFRIQRRDGACRWILCRATALRREDGTARRVTGIFSDITGQKESEEERLRYHKLLAQLAENFPDVFYITEMSTGKKEFINQRFTQMFGYSQVEFDALATHTLTLLCPPDDRDRIRAFEAQRHTLKDGEYIEVEYRLRHKNGDWRWVHWRETVFARDAEGVVTQIFGIAQDVTARKQIEERKDARLAEAEAHAERDALTGLYNRRAFLHRLQEEAEYSAASEAEVPLTVALLDLDSFKFFNDAYGHLEGDVVLRTVADALRSCCREKDMLARLGGDEFAAIFPGMGRDGAERRIKHMKEVIARLGYRPADNSVTAAIPIALSGGVAIIPEDGITPAAALRVADERLYRDKIRQRESWSELLRSDLSTQVKGFSMLDALVTSVDCKDRYTRLHSEDVLVYALQIAEELGLSDTEQEMLKVAALLHDVGKIGVPERILRQPGALTPADFEAVKQHAELGAIIVGAVPGLAETLPAIRHHHERWDGKGYPDGLAGESIPFMARLLAVADAFSAMTTDRPYRPGLSVEEALRELERGSGIQWDPTCVAAFLRFRHRDTRDLLLTPPTSYDTLQRSFDPLSCGPVV